MARKTTKKTSGKTSRKKSTKSTTKSTTKKLTPAQKKLKEQVLAPWYRVETLGFEQPRIYDIEWGNRYLSSEISAKILSGIGNVTDGEKTSADDYRVEDYSWGSFIEKKANKDTTTPNPEGRYPDRYELRDDQEEDKNTILDAWRKGSPEFLVANSTGTGKTVTTWSTVQDIAPETVLVVCPAAVIPVWRQHIADMGDKGITVVVINYESLKKLVAPPTESINARTVATQNKHRALKGKPYYRFDLIIFDEAHKLGNPTSQQSRIATTLAGNAKFSIRLTATPGKDPAGLHHLWRGLSWVTGDHVKVTDDTDFSSYISWCRKQGIDGIVPAPFGNGISFNGGDSDIEKMRDILYTEQDGRLLGIKRVPDGWGDTVRAPLTVQLSSAERKSYKTLVDDTMRTILGEASSDRPDLSKGLAAMVALRQKTGLLKAPTIVEYTKYAVKDLDEQVVISAIFHRTVDTISELLERANIPFVVITGRNTSQEKEDARRDFQQGIVPVVITSVTSGISLHANEESVSATDNDRRMIVADLHWSPREHLQLEGRINRNGEQGTITIPFLSNTIDEKVTSTLLKGMRSHSIIQDTGDVNELGVLADALGVSIGDLSGKVDSDNHQ